MEFVEPDVAISEQFVESCFGQLLNVCEVSIGQGSISEWWPTLAA